MNLSNSDLLITQALVDGLWIDADDGSQFPVHDPFTGAKIADVARCGTHETARAISAAAKAQAQWMTTTAKHRAVVLRKWCDLVRENQEDLALLLTTEQGKPLAEARGEIAYGASYLEWFAEECKRIYGDTIATHAPSQRALVIKQPVGVVACITPWNFPNAMLLRKMAPAIAAGCAVVCKPANDTPLSALAVGKLAQEAGMPAGLINILAGNTKQIGAELTSNPIVRKLTFTGSTAVGKLLVEQCAATMKRTSMELGGNAPFIVFDDADLDEAVKGAIICKYRNAGQTCVCANRFLVQDGIYDAFVEKFLAEVDQLKVGDGRDEATTVGPLISEKAATDVLGIVEDAVSQGAQVLSADAGSTNQGCFVAPTVLVGVTEQMRAFREEIFGPVAPIARFQTEQDAISMANNTDAGLAAYFYSRDVGRVWRVSEALEYGIVGINESIISNEMAPFGGIKESGHGREGSKYGMDDYLNIKYICVGGI